MAKQRGVIKIEGTLGDVTFLKTEDGYIVKNKTTVNKNRISSDPAFQRTRENMAEFGAAGKASKLLRNAVRPVMQFAKDSRVTSRLTGTMSKVIKADATGMRGQRIVKPENLGLLQGFNFNINSIFESVLHAQVVAGINRPAGSLSVTVSSFVPHSAVVPPQGATHFKLISAGAEVNFESETFTTAATESPILAIGNTATSDIILENLITPGSTDPLFLLLGIQFYQQVNGVDYPLKNGAYNALSLISIDPQ